jgi:cytoskeleton protein RodZ
VSDGAPASIGRYLANQRRLRGITLEELSDRTKIPSRNLERLEAGAFDRDPDGFARGFVRTVAEALGLDPDEAVMRLLAEPPASELEFRARAVWRDRRALLVLALVPLLGTVVWIGWRFVEARGGPGSPPAPALVFRHDVVGELVEADAIRAAPPAVPEAGRLDSEGGEPANRSADPADRRLR